MFNQKTNQALVTAFPVNTKSKNCKFFFILIIFKYLNLTGCRFYNNKKLLTFKGD